MDMARAVSVLALAAAAAMMAPGCGCAKERSHAPVAVAPEIVPAKLRVDGPVVARVHARGVQVYTSEVGKDGALAWAFTAPDATFEGDCTGKHFKGPTWECAEGAGKVEGHKLEDTPAQNTDAVPWLLMDAKPGTGTGRFSSVTFIQRLNTTGGKPPAQAPTSAGEVSRSAYTADYVFYGTGAKRTD